MDDVASKNGAMIGNEAYQSGADVRQREVAEREVHRLGPHSPLPHQPYDRGSVGGSSIATSSLGGRSTGRFEGSYFSANPLKALEYHMPRLPPNIPTPMPQQTVASSSRPPARVPSQRRCTARPRQLMKARGPAPYQVAGQSYGPLWTKALRKLDPELNTTAAATFGSSSQASIGSFGGQTLETKSFNKAERPIVSAGGRVLYPANELFGEPAPRPRLLLDNYQRLNERAPTSTGQRNRLRSPLRGLRQTDLLAPPPSENQAKDPPTVFVSTPVLSEAPPTPAPVEAAAPTVASVAETQWVSVPQSRSLQQTPPGMRSTASLQPPPRTPPPLLL
jgi:hypothetical protein